MDKPTARIITGKLKGRRITLPDHEAVRPSRERVRQAIFNMLESRVDFQGATVVELCCGSGAWGLEAYSRGAAKVWLVDTDSKVARANVEALGNPEGVMVVQADARTWQPPAPVDMVLADPPYESGILQTLLSRAPLLGKPGSWWAVEYGADINPDFSHFENIHENRHGVSKVATGRFFFG